jgi:hypothetical protein
LRNRDRGLRRFAAEANARFVKRVVIKPVGAGRLVPPGERTDVYFVGADDPYPATTGS